MDDNNLIEVELLNPEETVTYSETPIPTEPLTSVNSKIIIVLQQK